METAVSEITEHLASLGERVGEMHDEMTRRFDRNERHFLKLKATIDVQHAALLSAIMSLKPTP